MRARVCSSPFFANAGQPVLGWLKKTGRLDDVNTQSKRLWSTVLKGASCTSGRGKWTDGARGVFKTQSGRRFCNFREHSGGALGTIQVQITHTRFPPVFLEQEGERQAFLTAGSGFEYDLRVKGKYMDNAALSHVCVRVACAAGGVYGV